MEIYLIGFLVALILALCYVFFQWYSGQNVTVLDFIAVIFCAATSWVGVGMLCIVSILTIYENISSTFWKKTIIKGRNKSF